MDLDLNDEKAVNAAIQSAIDNTDWSKAVVIEESSDPIEIVMSVRLGVAVSCWLAAEADAAHETPLDLLRRYIRDALSRDSVLRQFTEDNAELSRELREGDFRGWILADAVSDTNMVFTVDLGPESTPLLLAEGELSGRVPLDMIREYVRVGLNRDAAERFTCPDCGRVTYSREDPQNRICVPCLWATYGDAQAQVPDACDG